MSGPNTGSTNTVDQLLGHTNGPESPVQDREVTRARSSAYIVHGNYDRLDQMCDSIATAGLVQVEDGTDETDVSNEIHRRVHNYLTSLYSYNEQVRDTLSRHLTEDIHKGYFLPDQDNTGAPEYVQRLTFLWGLRNDFQHNDYWCLRVEHEATRDGYDYYHLRFQKQFFNATPKGDLDSAGDYLAHSPDSDQEYPLPYIGDFHRNLFNQFERDFDEWCSLDSN